MRRIKVAALGLHHDRSMIASLPDRRPLVYVVDDDEAVCQALAFALDLEGFAVEVCRTAEILLLRDFPDRNAFLVLDERLPGISGLEALRRLRARGVTLPAALVTTHPKPALRSAAAVEGVPILEKPLLGDMLLATVKAGLSLAD